MKRREFTSFAGMGVVGILMPWEVQATEVTEFHAPYGRDRFWERANGEHPVETLWLNSPYDCPDAKTAAIVANGINAARSDQLVLHFDDPIENPRGRFHAQEFQVGVATGRMLAFSFGGDLWSDPGFVLGSVAVFWDVEVLEEPKRLTIFGRGSCPWED